MIQPRMVESREGKRKRRIKVNKIQKGKQNTNLRAEEKIEEEKEKIEEERVMWKKLRSSLFLFFLTFTHFNILFS